MAESRNSPLATCGTRGLTSSDTDNLRLPAVTAVVSYRGPLLVELSYATPNTPGQQPASSNTKRKGKGPVAAVGPYPTALTNIPVTPASAYNCLVSTKLATPLLFHALRLPSLPTRCTASKLHHSSAPARCPPWTGASVYGIQGFPVPNEASHGPRPREMHVRADGRLLCPLCYTCYLTRDRFRSACHTPPTTARWQQCSPSWAPSQNVRGSAAGVGLLGLTTKDFSGLQSTVNARDKAKEHRQPEEH